MLANSRAYLITDQETFADHNRPQRASLLYEQGKITEEEVQIPTLQRHMLIRAVGVEKTVLTDTFLLDYDDKISLLLCSDGLSGYCSDDEIYNVILNSPFDDVADKLIELALSKGGRDNVTVAVISD